MNGVQIEVELAKRVQLADVVTALSSRVVLTEQPRGGWAAHLEGVQYDPGYVTPFTIPPAGQGVTQADAIADMCQELSGLTLYIKLGWFRRRYLDLRRTRIEV